MYNFIMKGQGFSKKSIHQVVQLIASDMMNHGTEKCFLVEDAEICKTYYLHNPEYYTGETFQKKDDLVSKLLAQIWMEYMETVYHKTSQSVKADLTFRHVSVNYAGRKHMKERAELCDKYDILNRQLIRKTVSVYDGKLRYEETYRLTCANNHKRFIKFAKKFVVFSTRTKSFFWKDCSQMIVHQNFWNCKITMRDLGETCAKEFIKALYEMHGIKLPYQVAEQFYATNKYAFLDFVCKNPNEMIKYDSYKNTFKVIFHWDANPKISAVCKCFGVVKPMDHGDYVRYIAEKGKVVLTPILKKAAFEDSMAVVIAYIFKSIGIRDVNIVNSAIKSIDDYYFMAGSVKDIFAVKRYFSSEFATKFVAKNNLTDSEMMIYQFRKIGKRNIPVFRKNMKKSGTIFNEFDLNCVEDIVLMNYRDYKDYDYSDERLNLEDADDEFVYKIPKNQMELSRIGSFMHHCVGGYGHQVQSGRTTIVNVMKGGHPYITLQVDCRGRLIQAKKKFNDLPEKDSAKIIMEYCQRHGIDYSCCYDLREGTGYDANRAVMYRGLFQQDDDGDVLVF